MIERLYGLPGLMAPIQSIEAFGGVPFNVSILEYILLVNAIRFIGILAMALFNHYSFALFQLNSGCKRYLFGSNLYSGLASTFLDLNIPSGQDYCRFYPGMLCLLT